MKLNKNSINKLIASKFDLLGSSNNIYINTLKNNESKSKNLKINSFNIKKLDINEENIKKYKTRKIIEKIIKSKIE